MPKTLERTRKQIAKKRQGGIGPLHHGSRDAKRLHKAQVRDERLEKIAAARRKQEQPLLDRAAHFQAVIRENERAPLSPEVVQQHVKCFVRRYDEDLDDIKKARRPGRPPSAKEDMMKARISALEKEYEGGFLIPDLTTEDNVALLDRWEGSWPYLTELAWVRISESGDVRPSSFPPNGDR